MIDIMQAVADSWNRSGINYAIASGLDSHPGVMGRDIDVVVDPVHLQAASRLVCLAMQQKGMTCIVRERAELVQHIGICPSRKGALIVDLFPGLRWGLTWLVERPSPSGLPDAFLRDPWASFVKRILLHVLVAPTPKFAKDPGRLTLTKPERLTASTRLPRLFGATLASRLLRAIEAQDIAGLEELRPGLRRTLLISTCLREPLRALRASRQWAATRLAISTSRPAMPIISIVGPDGVGKSSVISEVAVQARERLRCPRVEVRHWRPGALPSLGRFLRRAPPIAGTPPRRTAGSFGQFRSFYYALDFLLGYYLRDRRVSVDLGLVIYDRGALDMYVDPLRYGLASGRSMRSLLPFLPRPDLVVLLYDQPGRIRARKAELEEGEIRRQLDLWMRLRSEGLVDMVVEVDGSPAALATRIVDRVVTLFVSMNGKDVRASVAAGDDLSQTQ